MRRLWLALIFAVWASSCATAHGVPAPPQSAETAASTTLVLPPGRPARARGTPLTITLDAVDEDSRCPTGLTCIHAGDVSLTLRIEGGADGSGSATLRLNGAGREAMHSGYRITLVGVAPYPAGDGKIEPQAYRATVQIEKR